VLDLVELMSPLAPYRGREGPQIIKGATSEYDRLEIVSSWSIQNFVLVTSIQFASGASVNLSRGFLLRAGAAAITEEPISRTSTISPPCANRVGPIGRKVCSLDGWPPAFS
jgi:hypothetical protein